MSFYIGAVLNLVGSISINTGSNLIKYSHVVKEELPQQPDPKRYNAHRIWLIGIVIFVLGNILNFVSFSYGSQSMLSALGSVQFVTNLLYSRAFFNVAIDGYSQIATFVILLGNVTIVLFSELNPRTNFTASELIQMMYAPAYLAYLISAACLIVIFQSVHVKIENDKKRFAILQCRLSNPKPVPKISNNISIVCFSLLSGVVGTQSVLLAKSVSALLKETLAGSNQLGNPFTYLIIAAWLTVLIFWLARMHKALMFDATFIIPLLQVIWIVFSIASGGIYFQEFSKFEAFQAACFGLGVVLIVIGVVILAQSGVDDGSPKDVIPQAKPIFLTVFNLDDILAVSSVGARLNSRVVSHAPNQRPL